MPPEHRIPWYRSIRFRLVAAALVVEAVMLALLVANSYRLMNDAFESQTRTRVEDLAPLFNAALAGRVFQRDHSEIATILQQLVDSQHTGIRYIIVLDQRGSVLASAGAITPQLLAATAPEDTSIAAALADQTYDTSVVLTMPGSTIGRVRYGLALDELATLRDSLIRQSLAIALGAILLSLMLLAAGGYLIMRHIPGLLAATRRIASADYSTPIAITSQDEIALLAESFNLMAADLAQNATNNKRYQHELEFLAHHDPLTQLPNRILFADRLQLAMVQTQRSGHLLAIAYLDLDAFKSVNDTLGHEVGDQLLIMVAQRLRDTLRAGDSACRLGGDEFALLLDDLASIDECAQALQRLLDAIAVPYRIDAREVQISGSIGFTLYPFDAANTDTLLRHADQAMYIAKQTGRNRFHLFDAALDRQTEAQHSARSRIEAALTQNEFVLYYQPKVDMRSGAVFGAEALIRWLHPEDGLIPPGRFLPVVEDSSFAIPLGEWVIDTAMAQLAAWHKTGLALTVSVNISARHLQSPTFSAQLASILARHPTVPPAALELEIVESVALEDMALVARVIDACHALGVRFALDDFGTGYSSLSYFKRLKVDVLKIDQSFVRDLLTDAEDHAIVAGVISLTHAFQREVIAEGVETVAIGAALLALGCPHAQGYGIARPMPAAELPGWIASWRPDPLWQS